MKSDIFILHLQMECDNDNKTKFYELAKVTKYSALVWCNLSPHFYV